MFRRTAGSLWIVLLGFALYSAPALAASPEVLEIEGVRVSVEFADADFSNGTQPLLGWIKRSLGIVAAYYGHFPVRELRVRVASSAGGGVGHGTTFGAHGAFIRMTVGRDVTPSELINDWVLVHEMTHLALPDVGHEHVWLSEGLAVYVEGIERAQAGNRAPEDVWAEQVRSMPRGLPQPGDEGLDHTHTWGTHVLGRRTLLSSRRCRDPPAHGQSRRPADGTAGDRRMQAADSFATGRSSAYSRSATRLSARKSSRISTKARRTHPLAHGLARSLAEPGG